jgi:hypothetical protein
MANQDAATRASGFTLEGLKNGYAMKQAIDDARNNGGLDDSQHDILIDDIDDAADTIDDDVEDFGDIIGPWWKNLLMGNQIKICDGLLDPELVDIINEILNWIRIIVPIMVIALSTADFTKAVLSAEKDEMHQAISKLIKRLVIAIVIFFTPTLIHLLVNTYNDIAWNINDPDVMRPITDLTDCGIH